VPCLKVLKCHLTYDTLKDVRNVRRHKKEVKIKIILKSKKSTETETKNEIKTQLGTKLQSKKS
jgi:hypothetical protein